MNKRMKKPTLKAVLRFLPTGVIVILAAVAAMYLYARYTTRPWTRFGQVRAYVIEVAPRVSGRVVELPVHDNQQVAAGDLLFRIETEPYELSLRQAERNLDLARQTVAQLEAAVAAAEAMVEQKQAAVTSARGTVTQAEAGIASAEAAVSEAEAGLAAAQAAIDRQIAALDLARIELARAERLAEQQAGSVQTAQVKSASVKENEAALVSSQAGLSQAQAALDRAGAGKQEAEAQLLIAQNGLTEAEAGLRTVESQLAEARASLGEPGEANVRIQQALVEVDQARLNLSFTSVHAPSDGYVTNLQVNVGTFANAGQPQLAFVNSDSYWVYAFFRETQLEHIHEGDGATVTLMSRPDQPLQGTVDSINLAIYPPGIATSDRLVPQIQPTFNWVRLAQRVPVRIHLTEVPEDTQLIVGTTASVSIHPER